MKVVEMYVRYIVYVIAIFFSFIFLQFLFAIALIVGSVHPVRFYTPVF